MPRVNCYINMRGGAGYTLDVRGQALCPWFTTDSYLAVDGRVAETFIAGRWSNNVQERRHSAVTV